MVSAETVAEQPKRDQLPVVKGLSVEQKQDAIRALAIYGVPPMVAKAAAEVIKPLLDRPAEMVKAASSPEIKPPVIKKLEEIVAQPMQRRDLLDLVSQKRQKEFEESLVKQGISPEDATLIYQNLHKKILLDVEEITKPQVNQGFKSNKDSQAHRDAAIAGAWVGNEVKETFGKEAAKRYVDETEKDLTVQQKMDAHRALAEYGLSPDILSELIQKNARNPQEKADLTEYLEQGVMERMTSQLRTLADISKSGFDKEQQKQLEKEISKYSGETFLAIAKKDMEDPRNRDEEGKYKPSKDMELLIRMHSGNLDFVPYKVNQ